jgi:alkylation response protein AidB-like acyl-CoA dehydrogenase
VTVGNHRVPEALATLSSAIRARRSEIEDARRLPRDLVEDLAAAGVFRLTVPRVFGGDEASPAELMRVIEAASAADGSVGWCEMNALGCNVAAGYMEEAGAREIFPEPGRPSAGIAAPAGSAVRVDGGIRVRGR